MKHTYPSSALIGPAGEDVEENNALFGEEDDAEALSINCNNSGVSS